MAEEQWQEAAQSTETFEKGGDAGKVAGKPTTITRAKAETRPYGGKNEETKDKVGTFVDIAWHADGEAEPITQQYRVGDPDSVRANADGSALLTKKGVLSDSSQYAKLLASIEASGYKLQTTKVTELVGQRFEPIAVAEKYDFKDKSGRQVKGESVKVHAKKYLGRLNGPLPASSATAAPLQQAAAPDAGGSIEERLQGEALAAIMANGAMAVKDINAAILATVSADQKIKAAKVLTQPGFYGSVPGLTKSDDGIVSLA